MYHPIALHPNLGDTSFDVILDDLLRRKRQTAGRLLVPPVDATADQAYFAERMAGLLDDDADLLAEIDRFGPLRFETWVIKQMQQAGWTADATRTTDAGGADAILRRDDRMMIVQCKHREDHTKSTSADAIDDLVRAREVYRMPDAELVAVTNAERFTEGARRRAVGAGVTLCARRDLSSLADILDRVEA